MDIIPINIRPVIVEIIVRFPGHGLCHREMPRITGVSQGHGGEKIDAVIAVTDSFEMAKTFAGDQTGGAVAQTSAQAIGSITSKNVCHREWVHHSCYCIEVLPHESDTSNVLRRVHAIIRLAQGLRGHWFKTTTWKEDCYLLRIMKYDSFSPVSGIRVELISRIRHRIFVCMVQRRLIVAGYRSKHTH